MKSNQYLPLIAFFLVNLSLNAQTKYEFMIIEYNRAFKKEIIISIDGKEFLSEEANLQDEDNSPMNANPILIKIKQYQDKGWEVMNFDVSLNTDTSKRVYFAYLKRKID